MDRLSEAPSKNFFAELESARGIAALLVGFFHASQAKVIYEGTLTGLVSRHIELETFWRGVQFFLKPILGAGIVSPIHPAVLFFFVLSGFVLAGSLERNSSLARFVMSRAFRIYPAVFFNILLFCVLYFTTGLAIVATAYGFSSIVENALLIKTTINGVMWALQNELLAIPFILAAFAIRRFFGLPALVIVTLVLMSLAPWDPMRAVLEYFGVRTRVGWMWAFLLGMCTYYTAHRAGKLPRLAAGILIATSIVAFFSVGRMTPENHPSKQIVEAIAAAVIIGMLAYGPKTSANRFLHLSVVRFYGRISYSFYICHALTLTVLYGQPEFISPPLEYMTRTAYAIVLCLVSTAVATPIAWLSYRYVEQPGIALGKKTWALLAKQHPQQGVTAE